MRTGATIIVSSGIAIAFFGVFVAIAQSYIIIVPYFTPTLIEFETLQERYPVNGSISYTVSLRGYGSNCIAFKVEMFREIGSLSEGRETVAYWSQIQDCRTIELAQGPYNYSKNFTYSGYTILGKPGKYQINVEVFDQITKQKSVSTKQFYVES